MRKVALVALVVLLSLPLSTQAARKDSAAPTSITILASDSLDLVLADLFRSYSIRSGQVLTAVFGAPDELVQAILAGDPADIILLEDPAMMKRLMQEGVLDVSTQVELAGNRLVFAAWSHHRLAKAFPQPVPVETLMADYRELEMVMADPATLPSGRAAEEAFTKLGFWDKVMPLLIRAGGARDALILIGRGERTGVLYYSDTVGNPEVAILADIPTELHKPITYQGAVVAGDYMTQARDFLAYLKTEEAKAIFRKHGFSIPE